MAVIADERWASDDAYLVRLEALRQDFTCERGEAALDDPNQHVVLLAIDRLADGCSESVLERLVEEHDEDDWRIAAHALVSLAKLSPATAEPLVRRLAGHPVWQMRAWVARAAQELGDTQTLRTLRERSQDPNVIAAALTTDTAMAYLDHDHYGLLMRALNLAKETSHDDAAMATVLNHLRRLTEQRRHTSRDPRMAMIGMLAEHGSRERRLELEAWLDDFDPAIAARAAEVVAEAKGATVRARTMHFAADPMPSREQLLSLDGASAELRMQGLGSMRLELYPDEAPFTVAQFVALAESGYYEGLTFHRVVPNFVLQGGSPGANEYVGTSRYIRDELGGRIHERGTLGISTRGRDTGDSQIFINLVDNYRLDHNYTVFARVTDGMDVVDRIQEGDVIEKISISYQ